MFERFCICIRAFLHDVSARSLYILSMMFPNFVHTICAYNFTPAFLCPSTVLRFLNTVSTFLPLKIFHTSTGDTYATYYVLRFNYMYIKSDCVHFANGSEQSVELHILRHQVTQELPTFKKSPVIAMWHEHLLPQLNRTLFHGAVGMLNHLDLQKCKPKMNVQLQ